MINSIIKFLIDYSDSIVNFFAIVASVGSIILWSHRSLHKDIQEVKQECKDAHKRIDATNRRIDAMGKRIDGAYSIMMAMLTKKDDSQVKKAE